VKAFPEGLACARQLKQELEWWHPMWGFISSHAGGSVFATWCGSQNPLDAYAMLRVLPNLLWRSPHSSASS